MKTRAKTAVAAAKERTTTTKATAEDGARATEAAAKKCARTTETVPENSAECAPDYIEYAPEDYAEYTLEDDGEYATDGGEYASVDGGDYASGDSGDYPSVDSGDYPSGDSGDCASGDGLEDATTAATVHSLKTDSIRTRESVIVISDDEDADCTLGLGNSVLIIEEPFEKSLLAEKRTEELVVDEELAITFTRSGNVMPHARYDCMAHPFVRTENDTSAPLENNADVCDQCYCYLCDKLALECVDWTTVSICHCNAHNKSTFWKSQRDSALAGILTIFNFDLTEIDAELRHGGFLLLTCIHELSVEYNRYLMGARVCRDQIYPCTCTCHQPARNYSSCNVCRMYHSEIVIHSYTEIYKKVEGFLNKAETEKPKSAAVLLLGLVKELIYQKEPPMAHQLGEPTSILRPATGILLGRILSTLQKMLVLCGFPKNLYDKFIQFFQSLPLPPHCYTFTNSLNVIPWDDLFLITILLGQNITGQRTKKGKKEFLFEALPVIQARVQKLEEEGNYKQLVRYLKAVRCHDMLALKYMRERIPFYMCKSGNLLEAAQSLIQLKCAYCSIKINVSVPEFIVYVKIFRTESCPSGNQLIDQEEWTPLEGIRMKSGILIKLILRIIYANKSLVQSPQCWSTLIRTWCSSRVLGPNRQLEAVSYAEPPVSFQRSVMDVSTGILKELERNTHVNLPGPFTVMPNEAELILIVRALAQRLLFDPRPPSTVLEIILAFGKNIWALRDLLEAITPRNDLVYQFTTKLVDELFAQKNFVLRTWSGHGPHYLSHLIYTFLTHMNALVRSVGFHMMEIVMGNFKTLPWAQQIAHFLQSRVMASFIYFTPAERNELKNKIALCQMSA